MAADVADLGYVESNPKQDGRNMIMVIGPHKKKAEAKAEQRRRRPDETEANATAAAAAAAAAAAVPEEAAQA
jgi:translation initiation factor IF-3